MKCENCGAKLNDTANFCRVCGTAVNEENKEKKIDATDTLRNEKNNHELSNNNKNDKLVCEKVKTDNMTDLSDTSELLLGKTNSSKKIEQILNEMTPEETDIDEPTVAIPSDLIKKYAKIGKNENIINSDTKETINTESKVEVEEKKDDAEKTDDTEKKEIQSFTDKTVDENKEKEESIETEEKLEKIELQNEKNSKTSDLKNILNEKSKEVTEDLSEVAEHKNDLKLEEKYDVGSHIKEIPERNEKKKYGRTFFTFFVIMICLCSIGYLAYIVSNSKDELEKIDKENSNLQEELDSYKSGQSVSAKVSDTISFNGYKFSFPNDGEFSILNDKLTITINDSIFSIIINSDVEYSEIKNSTTVYINKLRKEGYDIDSYAKKRVDNREYFVYEVVDKEHNKNLIAYTSLDDGKAIAFVISNKDNTIDYNLLKQANIIVSSMIKETSSVSNNVEVFASK